MSTPASGIRFIHKAIRAELDHIEALSWDYLQAPDGQLPLLCERAKFLSGIVRGHAEGEDAILYPALEQKFPQISESYQLEHVAEDQSFKDMALAVARIEAGVEVDAWRGLARGLYRQAVANNAVLSLHIQKEEQHLIPLVEQCFSIAEQADQVQKMIAHMPRELVPPAVPWILRALSGDEREEYLRGTLTEVPPEVGRAFREWARAGLPAEDWSDLVKRMPELMAN